MCCVLFSFQWWCVCHCCNFDHPWHLVSVYSHPNLHILRQASFIEKFNKFSWLAMRYSALSSFFQWGKCTRSWWGGKSRQLGSCAGHGILHIFGIRWNISNCCFAVVCSSLATSRKWKVTSCFSAHDCFFLWFSELEVVSNPTYCAVFFCSTSKKSVSWWCCLIFW